MPSRLVGSPRATADRRGLAEEVPALAPMRLVAAGHLGARAMAMAAAKVEATEEAAMAAAAMAAAAMGLAKSAGEVAQMARGGSQETRAAVREAEGMEVEAMEVAAMEVAVRVAVLVAAMAVVVTAAAMEVVATAAELESESLLPPAGTPAPAAGLAAAVACMGLDHLGWPWLSTVALDADPHRGWQPRTNC